MSTACQIVVCGSIVPDPLQTLEPITGAAGPALKNEMMLPAVLDPWASHALYEAANLVKTAPGSKVWLVSLGPKAKLQQVMMTVAQKVPFELVALDGPASVKPLAGPSSATSSNGTFWATVIITCWSLALGPRLTSQTLEPGEFFVRLAAS